MEVVAGDAERLELRGEEDVEDRSSGDSGGCDKSVRLSPLAMAGEGREGRGGADWMDL